MAHEFQITSGTHVYSREHGYKPVPEENYKLFQNPHGGWTASFQASVDADTAEAAREQLQSLLRKQLEAE
jgi:hypothetical protein